MPPATGMFLSMRIATGARVTRMCRASSRAARIARLSLPDGTWAAYGPVVVTDQRSARVTVTSS